MVSSTRQKSGNWPLGKTSERYESGGRGPGVVSTGRGDYGGVSYGAYQMSSRKGVVQRFVAGSRHQNDFAGLAAASGEFNDKWREIARNSPEEFMESQDDFIKRSHYDVQVSLLRTYGLPLDHRRAAIHDMIWSTSVQFGPSTKLIKNAISGLELGSASDRTVIETVQNYKIDNNARLFASSPTLQPSLLNRAKDEKEELLKLEQDGHEID